jgi:SAM-dependent methyltransferase
MSSPSLDAQSDILHVPSPDDPEYVRKAQAEAEFWGRESGLVEDNEARREGPIEQYTNERFTGDRRTPWYEIIAKHGGFRRGLVLGASGMKQDARILEGNPQLHLAFYDISGEALERWERDLGARFPGRVSTVTADLNFAELAPIAFDLIVSSATLHHVLNLEHVAYQINRALTPDGRFFLQDYAAETRYRFSEGKKRIFELLYERALRRQPGRDPRLIWHDGDNGEYSPFCGIRSAEILPTMRAYLIEIDIRACGALIGPTLFTTPIDAATMWTRHIPLSERFRERAKIARAWLTRGAPPGLLDDEYLREIFRVDSLLCEAGILLPHNVFAVYGKRV